MPIVRSQVLLPDMFDPLTARTRSVAPELQVVPDARGAGRSGWPSPSPSRIGPPSTSSGNGSAGFSKAKLASEPTPRPGRRPRASGRSTPPPPPARPRSPGRIASSRAGASRRGRSRRCAAPPASGPARPAGRSGAEAGRPSPTDRRVQLAEPGRLERLAFDPGQQAREGLQLARSRLDLGQGPAGPLREPERRSRPRPRSAPGRADRPGLREPADERANVEAANRPIGHRTPGRGARPRGSAPRRRAPRGRPRSDVVAEQGEVLAEVETRPELRDRLAGGPGSRRSGPARAARPPGSTRPTTVRAEQIRSNSEPTPKRSRSAA